MLEFPISGSLLEPSMFTKLAAFMIIQTFFVAAISGSVTKEISNIISNPTSIIDLLANSLPAQSTFFIQVRVSAFKRSSRDSPDELYFAHNRRTTLHRLFLFRLQSWLVWKYSE
jgi:hypothetical protein